MIRTNPAFEVVDSNQFGFCLTAYTI